MVTKTKPKSPRTKLIAKIKIRQAELGMGDEQYRALLIGVAGVGSCGEIQDLDTLGRVLDAMGPRTPQASARKHTSGAGSITVRQVWKLRKQWNQLFWLRAVDSGDDSLLNSWIERQYRVGRLEWLTQRQASQAIDALKAWIGRLQGEQQP